MLRTALEKIPRQRERAVNLDIVTANGLAAILPRLIELFLRDAPRRIEEMQAAAASGDLQALKYSAHTLAGSAANLGAGEVAQLSAALEAQARQGIAAGAAERLKALRRAFERAHAELSKAAEA
jgi:HPt (histidine-containing phosphotransfer) domain-containing protein